MSFFFFAADSLPRLLSYLFLINEPTLIFELARSHRERARTRVEELVITGGVPIVPKINFGRTHMWGGTMIEKRKDNVTYAYACPDMQIENSCSPRMIFQRKNREFS